MNVLAFFKALFARFYTSKDDLKKHFYSFLGLDIADSANHKNKGRIQTNGNGPENSFF